jgi:uncharacterized protein (DUF427 family)
VGRPSQEQQVPGTEREPVYRRRPDALERAAARRRCGRTILHGLTLGKERSMKAVWNGVVIAESDDTVVVEGNHYFPESAVQRNYLVHSNHRTSCAWKGQARYHSLLVNGDLNPDAVWYYPEPSDAAAEIKGRLAFWKGVQVID